MTKERIFVQIASYRDPECHHTIRDLFEKAAKPERIFVGVCWQYDPETDGDFIRVPYPRPEQVSVIQYHVKDAQGAGWARAQAQTLYRGEEYVLQIQAHHRFEKGWDETLIELLKKCPSEKPVLTAWLPGYVPPDKKLPLDGMLPMSAVKRIGGKNDAQMVHLIKRLRPAKELLGKVLPTPLWVGNFMFTRADTLKEVPFDPHIYFWGEEINYSARLFTHGYDIFHLDRVVLYHYWDRADVKDEATYRSYRNARNLRSRMRNLHLFGMEAASDAEALTDLDKYPLGRVRSLDSFWKYLGVDVVKRTITKNAKEGVWTVPTVAPLRRDDKKRPTIFVATAAYRDPEISATLADMFAKATHPDRITVGICLQYDRSEDADCAVTSDRVAQLRIHEVHYNDSVGANWARHTALSLRKNEQYILQIDSHMRFEPGWDETLIDMLARCPSDKPVISAYLPNYDPPDTRDYTPGHLLRIRVRKFGGEQDPQLLHITGQRVPFEDSERTGLYPTPLFIANFMFTRAGTLDEVPIDPHFHFYGDEISYSARLWTHGYDVFQPDRIVMFHYWVRKDRLHLQHYRNTRTEKSMRSLQRVRHLLGFERSNDASALVEIEKYGLGSKRNLADLWNMVGVDWQNKIISHDAQEGKWNMAAEGKAKKQQPAQPRIFVSIAAYRDPECQWTVKDLFEKAKYPDRINVGICWQFDPEEDQHCFEVSTRPDQVRIMPVDWREGEGVCWARNLTQQLWEGEDYSLQIDSHMRFVPGWDELIIAELAACDSPKPVLSCSPAAYTPPNHLEQNPHPTIRRVKPFFPDGNIRGQGEMLEVVPLKPLNGAFIAAGFVFARAEIIKEVPYDPYLYFDQEEITYAARLYTHGWDVFSTRRPFLYHYYNREGQDARPLHWNDLKHHDAHKISRLRQRGLTRFNHLTEYSTSNDLEAIKELAFYGFGRARSLAQYEAYSGVDFKRKIAHERALRCLFIQDLAKYRSTPIRVPELDGDGQPTAQKPALLRPKNAQQKTHSHISHILEVGDFVPMFRLLDTNQKLNSVETRGGKHGALIFLPANNPQYVSNFLHELGKHLSQSPLDLWFMLILDGAPEQLLALRDKIRSKHTFCADPDRVVANAFGITRPGDLSTPPAAFVVNTNLKIVARHSGMSASQMAEAMVRDGRAMLAEHEAEAKKSQVITKIPPALIVPNVFTKELCARAINAFRSGYTFDGTVGAEAQTAYAPETKKRIDFAVRGELQREIDDKLSRSLFPEIKKVFGFDVTHRETYKIGLYDGEQGGFFKQHRDNFDAPVGYRRIAATIHLNDDYEGGGLRFPEYDENTYRPEAGSAIAFSCANMHEARPVTKGERIVLVAFFHGEQEEAYRRHYVMKSGGALRIEDFTPELFEFPKDMNLSRGFFDEWQQQHIRYDTPPSASNTIGTPMANKPSIIIKNDGKHAPKKVFESKQAIVFDDFLPEDMYERLHAFCVKMDYEYINTKGKIARAWHVHDGFPLRSIMNEFYYAEGIQKAQGDYVYPTKTDMDQFIDALLAIQPQVETLIGKQTKDWAHVTATAWLYPPGTGLSLHDDGSNVYSGAYVYFLNPTWKLHWGGLLLMMDEEGNQRVYAQRKQEGDEADYYRRNWLHANATDDLLMEHGFAQCIFPKRNRIVFIANNAYHMVTRVNEAAGDNLRMSIAGFYNRKK